MCIRDRDITDCADRDNTYGVGLRGAWRRDGACHQACRQLPWKPSLQQLRAVSDRVCPGRGRALLRTAATVFKAQQLAPGGYGARYIHGRGEPLLYPCRCTHHHPGAVSYTHLRAHETRHDLVCRLLLEKKKKK